MPLAAGTSLLTAQCKVEAPLKQIFFYIPVVEFSHTYDNKMEISLSNE